MNSSGEWERKIRESEGKYGGRGGELEEGE